MAKSDGTDADRTDGQLPPLTGWQRFVMSVLGVLSAALAGLAFLGMFTSVRHAMVPYFGRLAWVVPIGLDDGLVLVALFSVVLECFGMRCRWLRWVELVFIGLQLAVNVSAGRGSVIGSAGHASLPVLYVTVIEIWQWFVRKRRNLIKVTDRERIPVARWFADFGDTWQIRKLMVLWNVNRYSDAVAMMMRIRIAESSLRRIYGLGWQIDADADLLAMLHTPDFIDDACEAIKKLDTPARKTERRAPQADSGNGPKDCCGCHRAISTKTRIPLADDAAQVLNAEHIRVHGTAIGADTLRVLFGIGSSTARQLRDRLAESGESGQPESGESGESGRALAGPQVGSGGG
jgi:hypothetical protein